VLFERVDEILPAQRANDVQGIVEHLEQNVVTSANAVKDDANLVPRTLAMRLSGSTGGVGADRADLLERTIGLIQTMLPLDYEGVREREVPMKENPLVWIEFENKIDDLASLIDIEHGEYKVLEVAEFLPPDIAIIESASRGSCHAFVFPPDAAVTVVGKSLAALQNY
jgi:predicted Ser/Thr protein kinase